MSNEFDLTLALLGHPVQTKDGRKVTDIKIVDENAPHSPHDVNEFLGEEYSQGITGVIHNLTGLHTYPFYHNGSSHLYGGTTEADLVMGENKTTSNNDTDCSGITLLRNPYGETYTYFISMTGGSGSLSHNKISKVVQDNNYEQFIIHFINGMKHQSFHHTGRDYLITDQAINDISALIGSIFCYYTKKPVISVDNYDNCHRTL